MSVLFSSGFPVSGLLLPEDGEDVEVCLEFPISAMRNVELYFGKIKGKGKGAKVPVLEAFANIGKWHVNDFVHVFLLGLQKGSHPHMEKSALEDRINLNVVMSVMKGISESVARAIKGDEDKGEGEGDDDGDADGGSEGNEGGW